MAGQSITEKWEYLTDIITSYDGHEQRIKLRQYPRHFVTYDYPAMNSLEAQWLRGLARIKQSDTWYIPQWHTPIRLSENVVGLGKVLYIYTKHMLSLYDCEWIEIFTKDDVNQTGVNIVRKVDNYFDGIIDLIDTLPRELNMKNTWIYPLKRCSVQPVNGLEYIWSNGTNVTVSFEDLLEKPSTVFVPDKYLTNYDDYTQRNRWKLPETIGDVQVFQLSPQWVDDSNLSLSIDKAVNRLDTNTGIFRYDLRNANSYDIQTWEFHLRCREQINNMLRFFKRVEGRFKSFYMPTWVNDVNIIKDWEPSDNFVYCDWSNIADYFKSNTRPKKICAFTKDWKSYIGDILTYSYDMIDGVKVGKIVLRDPIGMSMSKDNILMTSFVNRVRLDSDELQFNYETDEVANVTLVMKEVDESW